MDKGTHDPSGIPEPEPGQTRDAEASGLARRRLEIQEAIDAADAALNHLEQARELLASAGNWGMFDMLVGGMFSSMVKRDKMRRANDELAAARGALERFVVELRDVENMGALDLDMGNFMLFADVFFDNPFVDFYVQGQIREAQYKVDKAIEQVGEVRALLGRSL